MLPDLLDPWRAVEARYAFAGRLPLSTLPRLSDLLVDDGASDLRYRLDFAPDAGNLATVTGELSAVLKLRCQRCMNTLDHAVNVQVALALVRSLDEARGLPEGYDPLLVTEDLIRPRELIEEELILDLPQIPLHEPGACQASSSGTDDEVGEEAGVENPFAILAALKRKR